MPYNLKITNYCTLFVLLLYHKAYEFLVLFLYLTIGHIHQLKFMISELMYIVQ